MAAHVLEGVRVLELASLLAAPIAGMVLRDFGAEVLKVEDPRGGDEARRWPPEHNGMGLLYARVNMGKRSIAVDLRNPKGQAVIRELARDVDVVIENFRPGRLDGWNLGWEDLRAVNPRLVYVHVTGYGQVGPYRNRPGFGSVAESESGFAFVNGWGDKPPAIAPFGLGDSVAGVSAAYGTMLGLFGVQRTGVGREVDVALYEPMLAFMGDVILRYTLAGDVLKRGGYDVTAPRGCYLAKDDKWVIIAGSSDSVVRRLFVAMGLDEWVDDERVCTNAGRLQHRELVESAVRDWVGARTRSEVLGLLMAHDVAAGAVNDASDLVEEPAFLARGSIREVSSPRFGDVKWPGSILRLPGESLTEYIDPPELGQHTDEVLGGLGFTAEAVRELREEGVVA